MTKYQAEYLLEVAITHLRIAFLQIGCTEEEWRKILRKARENIISENDTRKKKANRGTGKNR
jgi:hypothetical protein